ncbi:ABC transporter substrate-binding protein [Marinobacterium zhoushanense]|uniref:ABC transporter substrate-binding protein n=1 Tax=Marinobacterium zhoushanense TaxID=1679163 RepID=A0ABQ1K3X9_9GAMM|nr:TRAP transporter substrate-binding protein [Marinobacterium zhoushanense]GGB84522.1 ABC transporter substrate-binding protein [Marinobacterium zhoushanense]
MKWVTNRRLKTIITAALAAMALTLNTASAASLRLSTPVPPGHIFSKVSERFAEELKAKSDGRLEIKVFPFGKLGRDPENAQMLQAGALNFAVIPAGFMTNRESSLNGWFLPGLFNGVEGAGKATQLPAAKAMLDKMDAQGMVGLGYVIAGMRHLISVEPVNSLTDIANKKVRAFPAPIFNEWWLSNNSAPTALPLPEIAPALTTNLLDIVDVDLDLVVALKLYQQAPNLTLTNHMTFPGIMLVSKKWWDKQSAEDQALIREVFADAEQWGIEEQAKVEQANLQTLKDAKVNIIRIDAADYAQEAKSIRDRYIENDKLIADFYNQVRAQQQ